MRAGDYARACAKFAESQRLDPAAGTLLNLAACERSRNELASSWQHYREALGQLAPGDDRIEEAARRVAELDARAPKLRVRLSADAPPGTTVTRDGVALSGASLGAESPVNPGRHAVVARANGHASRAFEVELGEGERRELVVRPGALALTAWAAAFGPGCGAPLGADFDGLEVGGGGAGGGAGRAGAGACPAPAERERFPLKDVEEDLELTCDFTYVLDRNVFVRSPHTLRIGPGTVIEGETGDRRGSLVVLPGAKLYAEGTAAEPVVFTSHSAEGARRPGDWGGLIFYGNALINAPGGSDSLEGVDGEARYGGGDPDDGSGSLTYVRIEYTGSSIKPYGELNGLTFAGVGRHTEVDFVEVRMAADACFEFLGGTVNAKHLICQNLGASAFSIDQGYQGSLQFLVLQKKTEAGASEAGGSPVNGFELDNSTGDPRATPLTRPKVSNVTLCGGSEPGPPGFGLLVASGAAGEFDNLLVAGFDAGLDVRDEATVARALDLDLDRALRLHSVYFFDNTQNVAYAEAQSEDGEDDPLFIDDPTPGGGVPFDEEAWVLQKTFDNRATSPPGLATCFEANAFRLAPPAPLVEGALTPADDGVFDVSASFIGAFRDATEGSNWAAGGWAVLTDD